MNIHQIERSVRQIRTQIGHLEHLNMALQSYHLKKEFGLRDLQAALKEADVPEGINLRTIDAWITGRIQECKQQEAKWIAFMALWLQHQEAKNLLKQAKREESKMWRTLKKSANEMGMTV